MASDIRIPVRFGPLASLRPEEAVLAPSAIPMSAMPGHAVQTYEAPSAPPGSHPVACACCVPRGPIASAMTRLFLARMRGEAPFFTAVLAADAYPGAEAAIREAIRRDPLVGSRFRAAPGAAA